MVLIVRSLATMGSSDNSEALKRGIGGTSPVSVIDTCWDSSEEDDCSSQYESSIENSCEPDDYFEFDFTERKYFPGTDCPVDGWFQPCEGCSKMTARTLDMADGTEHPVCARCAANYKDPSPVRLRPQSEGIELRSMQAPSNSTLSMEREQLSGSRRPGETDFTRDEAGCNWLFCGYLGAPNQSFSDMAQEDTGDLWKQLTHVIGSLGIGDGGHVQSPKQTLSRAVSVKEPKQQTHTGRRRRPHLQLHV